MVNTLDIKYSQLNLTMNTQKTETKSKIPGFDESLVLNSKTDFLDISSQIQIMESQNQKNVDFTALESKLGIDSDTWGVEAVSDDLLNFADLMFGMFKLNHSDEDSQEVLDSFYKMAKDSYTQGYGEARDFLGELNNDVGNLIQGTFDKTMEKLDAWYENGGKTPEKENTETKLNDNNQSNISISISQTQIQINKAEGNHELIQTYLDEADATKNEILDTLKQQGLYINSESSKHPSYDFKG